ncbi:MAG: S4 domain-containing protein [Pseudomonadota bacterium]
MEKLRIDKWLWAARFYKTRALAAKAVSAGKVKLAGERVKPARLVQLGDELEINRERDIMEIIVERLLDKRGPAKIAVTMYHESEQSVQRRADTRDQRRVTRAAEPSYGRRPDKRNRRKIGELLGKREWQDR